MLGAMAGQMAQGTAVEITWNGAFDPTGADFAGGGDGVEWERVDDETWEADMIIAPETPPVGTLRMQITEPDNIESITMMSVGKMMEAQGQVIPGLESCVLTVISDMAHSGGRLFAPAPFRMGVWVPEWGCGCVEYDPGRR